MSPLVRMLYVLVSVSVMLAPLSNAHAHVTDTEHQHINVQGGHDHGLGATHEEHGQSVDANDHDASVVVDLAPDLSKANAGLGKVLQWVAILCATVLAILAISLLRTAHPPPRSI